MKREKKHVHLNITKHLLKQRTFDMARLHAFEHASHEVGSICRHDVGTPFPTIWEHRKSLEQQEKYTDCV